VLGPYAKLSPVAGLEATGEGDVWRLVADPGNLDLC
jgi:hypothetical protein